MLEPNDIINQVYLNDNYRTFYQNTKENNFLTAPHGTFSETACICVFVTPASLWVCLCVYVCICENMYPLALV